MKFSVLMSVYKRDIPEYLDLSLASIINQSLPPTEIVLVKDGPLSEGADEIIEKWRSRFDRRFHIIALDNNKGLGRSLNIGLNACTSEIVARMDADDICKANRFELQLGYLEKNSNIDVLSSCIAEFDSDSLKINQYRRVPLEPEKIIKIVRYRNPVNHMAVMFKRKAVLAAGSYKYFLWFEDYYLWARMIMAGYQFANLPDILVYVRADDDLFRRRGGLQYLKQEVMLQNAFLRMGFINVPIYLFNITVRTIFRIIPNNLRSALYKKFLR